MRIGLLASGRGSNARAILQAVRDGRLDAEVPVLICNRSGAGVLDVAAEFGVPVQVVLRGDFPTRTAQQLRMLEHLQAAEVDVLALAGFSAILKPPIVAAYPNRILNTHPSLLPAFGGTVDWEADIAFRSYERRRGEEVVERAWRAAESVGITPRLGATGGGSDANVLNAHGLPALNIGMGISGNHSPEERVAVADLEGLLRLVLAIAEQGA